MSRILIHSLLLLAIWSSPAWTAPMVYDVLPEESFVKGSIGYTLIGQYRAQIRYFAGDLVWDAADPSKSSINIDFHVDSIDSSYPRLDRIVKSPRLLHTERYPYIKFESHAIRHLQGHEYLVEGRVTLRGIDQDVQFPFHVMAVNDGTLTASGNWALNRKDFGIVWHSVLDRGGVIVSDQIVIDWKLTAAEK